jgi:hypothetical protein
MTTENQSEFVFDTPIQNMEKEIQSMKDSLSILTKKADDAYAVWKEIEKEPREIWSQLNNQCDDQRKKIEEMENALKKEVNDYSIKFWTEKFQEYPQVTPQERTHGRTTDLERYYMAKFYRVIPGIQYSDIASKFRVTESTVRKWVHDYECYCVAKFDSGIDLSSVNELLERSWYLDHLKNNS